MGYWGTSQGYDESVWMLSTNMVQYMQTTYNILRIEEDRGLCWPLVFMCEYYGLQSCLGILRSSWVNFLKGMRHPYTWAEIPTRNGHGGASESLQTPGDLYELECGEEARMPTYATGVGLWVWRSLLQLLPGLRPLSVLPGGRLSFEVTYSSNPFTPSSFCSCGQSW